MPLPLVPIAAASAAALAAWSVVRALRPGRTDLRAEDAMDGMEEGVALHRPKDRGQTNAAARFRRTLRWGGRAVEIDATALARFRIRRV